LLTTIEKIIFIVLAITAAGFTFHGFKTIIDSIRKGRPAPELKNIDHHRLDPQGATCA